MDIYLQSLVANPEADDATAPDGGKEEAAVSLEVWTAGDLSASTASRQAVQTHN